MAGKTVYQIYMDVRSTFSYGEWLDTPDGERARASVESERSEVATSPGWSKDPPPALEVPMVAPVGGISDEP